MVPPKYFITTSPLFIMKHTEEQRVVMEKPLVRWREYRCLVLPSDLTWWPLEPAGTCWLQHLWRGCCELLVDNMLGNTALMRPQQVILEFPGTSYQAGACLCWRGASARWTQRGEEGPRVRSWTLGQWCFISMSLHGRCYTSVQGTILVCSWMCHLEFTRKDWSCKSRMRSSAAVSIALISSSVLSSP